MGNTLINFGHVDELGVKASRSLLQGSVCRFPIIIASMPYSSISLATSPLKSPPYSQIVIPYSIETYYLYSTTSSNSLGWTKWTILICFSASGKFYAIKCNMTVQSLPPLNDNATFEGLNGIVVGILLISLQSLLDDGNSLELIRHFN